LECPPGMLDTVPYRRFAEFFLSAPPPAGNGACQSRGDFLSRYSP
jgi:hypothetical protein